MKQFCSASDIENIPELIGKYKDKIFLDHKKCFVGLVFFQPSTRTRMSMQRAVYDLGMEAVVLNVMNDSWQIEMKSGVVMNGDKTENVHDLAAMMGLYCDIIAVRCFAGLKNKSEDEAEIILSAFQHFSGKPVINMESCLRHPLQSLADVITIEKFKTKEKPKVVLTWAPHVKALPQAVPNSFLEWCEKMEYELAIANPVGMDLSAEFTRGIPVFHQQENALEDADFIYVKNWSSYENYGQPKLNKDDWMLNNEKLKKYPEAKIMHCMPVRRNLELADEVIDGNRSLLLEQAANRLLAAKIVLNELVYEN